MPDTKTALSIVHSRRFFTVLISSLFLSLNCALRNVSHSYVFLWCLLSRVLRMWLALNQWFLEE